MRVRFAGRPLIALETFSVVSEPEIDMFYSLRFLCQRDRRMTGHGLSMVLRVRAEFSFPCFLCVHMMMGAATPCRRTQVQLCTWSHMVPPKPTSRVSGALNPSIETDVRNFVETFDHRNERGGDEKETAEAVAGAFAGTGSFPRTATVGADSFVSRAVADPAVVRFLGMRPSTGGGAASGSGSGGGSSSTIASSSHLTLREALRELVGGASGGGARIARPESRKPWLRWEDVEELLFRPYDPTEIFSNPPSTVQIGFAPADPRGAKQQEEVRASLGLIGFLWKRGGFLS